MLQENLKDSCSGDGKKHTCQIEKISENADRKKNEERMKAGGIAYDAGVKIIAVQLLHQEKGENRSDGFCRTPGEKNCQKSQCHCCERTEVWYDVQNTGCNAYDNRKWNVQHRKNCRGKKGNDKTVQKCTFEKGGNDTVDFPEKLTENAMHALGEQQGGHPAGQKEKVIPVLQQVDRSDDSQEE